MKMLTRRLKDINTKITDAKSYLKRLRRERSLIKTLFLKERDKTKIDPDVSKDTSYSKISGSYRPTYTRDGTSLGRINSLTLTTPPRSPRSRNFTEDQAITPNGAHLEESQYGILKQYSKSMTFSEKVMEIVAHGSPNTREENQSPEFKRLSDLSDVKPYMRNLETVNEQTDLNDSLSEEINKQLSMMERKSNSIDTASPEIVKKYKGKRSAELTDDIYVPYKEKSPQKYFDESPSFCKTGWQEREVGNSGGGGHQKEGLRGSGMKKG